MCRKKFARVVYALPPTSTAACPPEAAFDTVASSEAASLYEDDARTGCHSYSAGQASYDQQPPELPSRPGGSPRDTGDGGDHRCLACGVSFVSPPELMSHLRSHVKHSPEHKFTCQVCSEQFTRSIELARHRRTHTKEKLFNCDVCDKWFSSQRNLTRHKARHNPSDTQSCPVCHKVFSCMFTLKRHAKLHGGTRGSTSSDPMFKCHFCDQMFTAKTDLLSHFKVHRD